MTYTVLGRCHRTGRVGIGIATFSITVGRYCYGVKSNAGVTVSQAFANERNNALALAPADAGLHRAIGAAAAHGRTIPMPSTGRSASSTAAAWRWPIPARTRAAGRAMSSGENYVAFGNGLVGPEVADAIAKGFLAEPDADLEHRLLMGIEAGRDAGGQGTRERHKAERSAALRVYSTDTFADIDLRVDLHATAVEELRRVWTEYKQYEAYYRDRERNPSGAMGQEEFMKTLRAAEA